MRQIFQELSWQNLRSNAKSMGLGSYALIAALFALLAVAVVTADIGWQYGPAADVPPVGYVMMLVGIVLSVLVGAGLMALVFYSNREGHDQDSELKRDE